MFVSYQAIDLNLADYKTHKRKIINTYILEKLRFYKITNKKDERLWKYFKEHFEGWSSALFHVASPEVRGKLRDYLRSRGVFVNNRKRTDHAL